MIKIDSDKEVLGTFALSHSDEANIDNIQLRIQERAQEQGLPATISLEEAKVGGMFSDKEPALVVSNPEHQKDYQKFAIVFSEQFSTTVAKIYAIGISKQAAKANLREISKKANKESWEGKNTLGNAAKGTAALFGLALSLGKSEKKLEEEMAYYHFLYEIIDQVLTELS